MITKTPVRLTRAEAAARLRRKVNTLAHWAVAGKGPKFITLNGRVLYDLEVIEAWERENTHTSTAEYDTGARAANIVAGAAAYNAQRAQQAQASATA